jgi:hypothetical protein
MVIILTAAFVILGLGLALLVIGFKGKTRTVEAPVEPVPAEPGASLEYSSVPRRRVRIIPLVLGVLLTLTGGAAVAAIFNEGLDSDRYEQYVLAWTPADWLAEDLDDDSFPRRYTVKHELQRRYEANKLPSDVEQRLVNRQIARLTGEDDAPDAPAPGAPIVEFDFVQLRKDGRLPDDKWGKVVARTAPMRFDIPRRAAPGEPISFRLTQSLADPKAPAWVIIEVQDLKIDDKPVPPIPAIAIAPNEEWEPAPPPENPPQPDPNAPPGPPPGPPPARRVVRHDFPLPADLVAALGEGSKQVTGKIIVHAFDPKVVAPPEGMTDEATFMPRARGDTPDTEQTAAAFSAQLTPEQLAEFSAKALGKWEYPLERRMEIGVPPATRPATRPAETEGEGDAAEGPGEGEDEGGGGGEGN